MKTIAIHTATIDLHQLLKLAGLAASGGDAKRMIADGLVVINGELETRKRKQLSPGDVVGCGADEWLVTSQLQ